MLNSHSFYKLSNDPWKILEQLVAVVRQESKGRHEIEKARTVLSSRMACLPLQRNSIGRRLNRMMAEQE